MVWSTTKLSLSYISKAINPHQFGFTKKQMLIFLDQIINCPQQTDVICFDISKAFDTVSHGILLNKLWSIGITGVLWTWFKDYLSNRYQRVSINHFSDLLPVVSSVPQGNILDPLLFLVHINDICMSSYINHSQFLKFADDTISVLFISVLYLTTMPHRRISLHYLPGPEILTNTSRILIFTGCHIYGT